MPIRYTILSNLTKLVYRSVSIILLSLQVNSLYRHTSLSQKGCLTASYLSDYVDYAKTHNAKIHNSSEHCNFSISRGILFNHFSQKKCTRFLRSYLLHQAASYMVSYLMLQRRKRGKPQLFYRLVYSALFIEHQPVRVEVVLMGVQQVYVAEIVAVP